jgi:uncharacterized coiled-coil protein SlyX
MCDLDTYIAEANENIDSIVENVEGMVDHVADEILGLDEDIAVQLREYDNCEDPDYRTLYHEDITGLVGRQAAGFDEIHEWIEEGRVALSKIEDAISKAYERLQDLEQSDRVPEETGYTVPPIYPPRRNWGGD